MNFIRKIKEFFERFKNRKTKLIDETTKDDGKKERKRDFIKAVDSRERQELLELQQKCANDEISIYDLSIYQVMGLTDLCREQIEELNKALEDYNNS